MTPIEKWWHGEEYHDCERLGITIQRIPTTSVVYARCVAVHLLTRQENGSNHNAYFDVIDEAGKRINGAVIIGQNNNIRLRSVIDKPPNEPGTNFSVYTQDTINAWVGEVPTLGVIPSDKVNGFSTRWGGSIVGGQDYGHISIWVLWMIRTGAPGLPPIKPPVEGPSDCAELQRDYDELRLMLRAVRDLLNEL